MLGDFSRLHSLWRIVIAKRKQFFLITTTVAVVATSGTAYYLANYSANLSKGETKQSQALESNPTSHENSLESSPSSNTADVKGVQLGEEVPKSAPITANPTTAPITNNQNPVYVYQPTTSDSNSYSYPSPTNDWYTERLHQMQEENAKRQEYCNQVREQRSAATGPYMAKRDEISKQMLGAIQKGDMELYRSLEKQYNEADKEFWSVYQSFDTSCI